MGKFSVLLPAVLELLLADASCALWAHFAISMREKDGGRRAKHMREHRGEGDAKRVQDGDGYEDEEKDEDEEGDGDGEGDGEGEGDGDGEGEGDVEINQRIEAEGRWRDEGKGYEKAEGRVVLQLRPVTAGGSPRNAHIHSFIRTRIHISIHTYIHTYIHTSLGLMRVIDCICAMQIDFPGCLSMGRT